MSVIHTNDERVQLQRLGRDWILLRQSGLNEESEIRCVLSTSQPKSRSEET